MQVPSILEVKELCGKRVLVRAGLNVPIKDGTVTNQFRIDAALQTLRHLHHEGARTLIVGHIGREPEETLKPVFEVLRGTLPISFVEDIFGDEAGRAIELMKDGDCILFENIRRYPEEKANDEEFARKLAALADLYVNDAFSASHRVHASIVGVPKFLPHCAGIHCADEVRELSKGLRPESPSLFVLGGAKFETKQPILKMSLETYDNVYVGGALAHDLLRARGVEIGRSLASDNPQGIEAIKDHPKLTLPIDAIVETGEGKKAIRTLDELTPDDRILDIGPMSTRAVCELAKESQSILWNGPLGYYEGGYGASTETLAEVIASRTNVTSIVGGGDTVAAIGALGLEKEFTFLSTGGGAMLDFLADGSLVGIEALKRA